MNARTIVILIIFILVSFGSFWFIRKPEDSRFEKPINILLVGTNAEFPPFSFIENDQIVGFDIDVVKEVARRLNKKIVLSNMSFGALIPELQLGTIHAIAAGITPTKERADRVFFTTPHLKDDPLMAVQKKDMPPITSADQLRDKTVVVNQGYTADHYVSNLGDIDAIRLSTTMINNGFMTLNSGHAQVFITSKSSLQPFVDQLKEYTISPIQHTAESSALAVSKKYPNLFTVIQSIISDMTRDGTIEQFIQKWNLND